MHIPLSREFQKIVKKANFSIFVTRSCEKFSPLLPVVLPKIAKKTSLQVFYDFLTKYVLKRQVAKLLRQFISDNVQNQPPTSDEKLMRSVGDMFHLEVELFEASPRKVTPELEKETTDAVTFGDFVGRVAAKVCKKKPRA